MFAKRNFENRHYLIALVAWVMLIAAVTTLISAWGTWPLMALSAGYLIVFPFIRPRTFTLLCYGNPTEPEICSWRFADGMCGLVRPKVLMTFFAHQPEESEGRYRSYFIGLTLGLLRWGRVVVPVVPAHMIPIDETTCAELQIGAKHTSVQFLRAVVEGRLVNFTQDHSLHCEYVDRLPVWFGESCKSVSGAYYCWLTNFPITSGIVYIIGEKPGDDLAPLSILMKEPESIRS